MGAYTTISIPLGRMNTKTEDSVLPMPEVALAKNVQVNRTGGYARRPGYAALSALDIAGNTVMGTSTTTVKACVAYRDAMVAFTNANKCFEYSNTASRWVDKGAVVVSCVDVSSLGSPSDVTPVAVDVAVTSTGYTVYTTSEADAAGTTCAVGFVVLDANGTVVGKRILDTIGAAAIMARVVAVGAKAYIVWPNDSNEILLQVVDCTSVATVATSLTAGTGITVTSTFGGGATSFDVAVRSTDMFFAYVTTTAGTVEWGLISTAATPVVSGTSSFATGRTPATIAVAVESGLAAHSIVYTDSTTPSDVYVLHRSWNGTAWSVTSTSAALDTTLSTSPGAVLAARFDSSTVLRVWYSCVETDNLVTYQATCTTAGVVSSRVETLNRTWLASKPFSVGSALYFWGWQCDTDNILQPYTTANPALYLFESSTGLPVAQALPGTAMVNNFGLLPLPQVATSGATYRTGFLEQTRPYVAAGSVLGGLATRAVDVSFADSELYKVVEDEDVLLIPGGMLQEYDGDVVVESGFLRFPTTENWTITASNGSGGLTVSKQYFYIVIPEAGNYRGHRVLGTHGGSKSVTMGGSDDTNTLVIGSITATRRQGAVPDLVFGVYRTNDAVPSDDSTYYRVGQVANDPAAATVTFVDEMTDGDAILQEQLYLGTGELDNVAPPSCRIIAKGNGRVVVAGGETQNSLYFSKRRVDGRAVEFNDALRVDCPSDGGPIVALAFTNTTLLIFKQGRIYRMHGEGPNNAGQGAFIEPELLTSDSGCLTQHSVVQTPMGVMFQSERGLMLIDQGFNVSYIGAPIENVSPTLGTCVDAVLLPGEQQVRFSDGVQAAVFDYAHGFWFIWSIPAEGPSCVFNDAHCIPHSSLKVLQQGASTWQDNAVDYNTIITLAWLSSPSSRLQNIKVRKVGVLGTVTGESQMSVVVYYDGSDNASFQEDYLDMAAGPLRKVFMPASKVGNQFRLSVQDVASNGVGVDYTTTAGFVLTEVTFEVLVKKGLHLR